MELYERQQFDFLLQTAVERWVERIEQRNEGPANALERLRTDREGAGLWMSKFVDAVFDDFLINNLEGACFVLRALAKRPGLPMPANKTVEQTLIAAAKQVFADVFYLKTEESLEQHSAFEGAGAAGD
jgi:hypothetical protein